MLFQTKGRLSKHTCQEVCQKLQQATIEKGVIGLDEGWKVVYGGPAGPAEQDAVSLVRKLGSSERKSVFIFSEESDYRLQVVGAPCSGSLPDLIRDDVDSVFELLKDCGFDFKLKVHEILFPSMNARLLPRRELLGDWRDYFKSIVTWLGILFASLVWTFLSFLLGFFAPSALSTAVFGSIPYIFAIAVISITYWIVVWTASRKQRYILVL